MKKYIENIREYSQKIYMDMTREPEGALKYPFIVPGSASYHNMLWDWDSWLTDIAVRQIMCDNGVDNEEFLKYEKGCVLNFVEHIFPSGRLRVTITPDYIPDGSDEKNNIHKPCLAQHAAFIVKNDNGDAEWLRTSFDKLKLFVGYYMNECKNNDTGLYFWLYDNEIGVDNDPCTFYRPPKSSASIYLNCLMYKELKAIEYICGCLGENADAYHLEAEKLKNAVNTHMWDERNGFYYSVDLNLRPVDTSEWLHSGAPRHWHGVIQKIDVWSGFMAMWSGIATEEQAQRMVKENMLRKDMFWAEYGIRTLSALEKMYAIIKSGNPSCWLGPVWGISNYMCFKALVDYGFADEAKELAQKSIRLFGEDIEKTGEMHEYYHPDTGEGLMNPGFMNWNLLVNNMLAWLEGQNRIEEF